MPLNIDISGTWKSMETSTPGGVYINVGGTWKVANEGWININDVWKKIFPETTTPTVTPTGTVVALAHNGSYYIIAGSFNINNITYAFAKSKSTFNPNYLILHDEPNAISGGTTTWYSYSDDGDNWYTEKMTSDKFTFHGTNLFGTYLSKLNCATSIAWNGVTWVGGGWSDGTQNSLAISTNGETWTGKGDSVLRINAVAWSGNTWCAGGWNSTSMNVIYSTNANASTWTLGTVKPFTDTLLSVQSNGSQWLAYGYDSGLYYKLKTSNILNEWTTRFDGITSGYMVWDGGNTRWIVAGGSAGINDGGFESTADGITWTLIGMPSYIRLGVGFLISNNRYLFFGQTSPSMEFKIYERDNADNQWIEVNNFGSVFSWGAKKRQFASRYAPYAIPPLT